jgi:hypothetical protein
MNPALQTSTYDKTFENSVEGDMTKLSFELDHEIKCWMPGSSNMLLCSLTTLLTFSAKSPLHKTYLYSLCINAVCTTFGCCVAAAAPTAGTDVPFVVDSYSPFVGGPLSVTGLLSAGGPIEVVAVLEGVMSIGSFALGIGELPEEEGRMGMALRPFGAKGSVKGLRDIDSVVAAMCAN